MGIFRLQILGVLFWRPLAYRAGGDITAVPNEMAGMLAQTDQFYLSRTSGMKLWTGQFLTVIESLVLYLRFTHGFLSHNSFHTECSFVAPQLSFTIQVPTLQKSFVSHQHV